MLCMFYILGEYDPDETPGRKYILVVYPDPVS